ncbi:MAG: hypothetical protein HY788_20280 [Deltaproteobacteria bacterium]|nr:hypothetical protein [Deltaproteobacteria bacterium]
MRKKNKPIEALTSVCLILLLPVALWSMDGCARAVPTRTPEKIDMAEAQDAPALESREEKVSYALGMVLGNQFRNQSIEVDPNLYVRGLKDGLGDGKTLMTEEEARAAVNTLQSELKRKRIAPPDAAAITDVKVSFKLDPRLTRGQYMGDRWLSPPTFTSTLQAGTKITVEARAHGLDALGRGILIDSEWIPSDPEMVSISPGQGKTVKLTVKRAGESRLKVVSNEITKELTIKAIAKGDAMQVEISQ